MRGAAQLFVAEWRILAADEKRRAARELLLDQCSLDHLVVQAVSLSVRREMDMEVSDPLTEDVYVHDLGTRRFLQRARNSRHHRAEGECLVPAKIGDQWDMAFRLQIGEPGHRVTGYARRNPPKLVLPHLHSQELLIPLRPTTDYAVPVHQRMLRRDLTRSRIYGLSVETTLSASGTSGQIQG